MTTLSSRFKTSLACLAGTLLALSAQAQSGDLLPGAGGFTRADTLRGTLTPERTWWDLRHYHLQVRVNTTDSTISGRNDIQYKVLKAAQVLQIDLQRPMRLVRATQDGQELAVRSEGNAHFVTLLKKQQPGQTETVTVEYDGKPIVAKRPPWDGGFTWARDANKDWFIATSCQGLGASAWWPCKDHMADEPDSMLISATVPRPYMDVSNGKLRRVIDNADSTRTFEWAVVNPINNYGVNLNIARYVSWTDTLRGEKGVLPLSFYVLPAFEQAARQQFRQAKTMLHVFEHWFGPYPFYEDGYKLVQTPYLGMEHQSSVTYGNRFRNGYLGNDLSGTGWGLKFDFIIIHESGHEWFANNITYKDIADMWIHESFTAYSECLFVESLYGKNAGAQYVIGTRARIMNDRPIIGTYNVNHEGSGDMYYKGSNMLHMIRQWVANDEKWRQILRGLNKTFYHQTVTTQQIETYLIKQTGLPLQPLFNQYLLDTRIPVLEYKLSKDGVAYRWANCPAGFTMPVRLCLNETGPRRLLTPTTTWQTLKQPDVKAVTVDADYYVIVRGL
ncbi:Peptidase M1 membrane alanine aminopeptidase [Fibrella aestuarina BUZ 2]|uniref:Peptidase M1 membrane alanine aminopeptidase n=1 Tax=Fibrella aestuarina BUZ 2 TaxID=1166018 RepID=I0KB12_9BACT|nr:M1 family metallopeptidase [Fibrella aestuarina]CCH01315.1 Peptidase M1 membrane alanine aminopeptidase [Fibrella aestuarina BUZ 2]